MSVEQARNFIEHVNRDPSLAQKLKAVESEDKEAALAQVVTLAAASGYEFTAADYEAATTAHIEAALAGGEAMAENSAGDANAGFLDLDLSDDDLAGWDPGGDL